jgi:hypothetical protein
LEWRVKAYLSQDEVAKEEITRGVDTHSVNQTAFNLPSRLIAKIYVFRQIFADAYSEMGFRRPAYAYAKDPDFQPTSSSIKFWTEVTEKFYNKYKGMYQHGLNLIDEVARTGQIVNPTGRIYTFSKVQKWNGDWDLPRTQILNYPVQGLAADLMCLARVVLRKRIRREFGKETILLINTVHDDIELDLPNDSDLCYNISIECENVMSDLPRLFEEYFGVPFDVPLAGEVSYGYNLKELIPFHRGEPIIVRRSDSGLAA